ncbi:MAG: 30S ribosomal protein S4 [Microgenomates group bacterium]
MSRITLDSKCRLCRAAGTKLYLKGARCLSSKCPIEKKGAIAPGMHGAKRSKKPTDYGIQLKAKQKAKRIFGVQETQFKNYFLLAKTKKGLVGENLLDLVARRLDNVVYEAGLSLSRSHAKQLISHRHILVNGKVLNIASYPVKKSDVITLDTTSASKSIDTIRLTDKDFKAPQWLDLQKAKYSVSLAAGTPEYGYAKEIDLNLIIEYYSR